MGLWLTPGFALMSYAALIEPFRAANALSDRPVYEWVHISADGAAVEASNGARISTDARVGDRSIVRCCSSLPGRSARIPRSGLVRVAAPACAARRGDCRGVGRAVPDGAGGPVAGTARDHPLGTCPGHAGRISRRSKPDFMSSTGR
jgi:hypothetical protein